MWKGPLPAQKLDVFVPDATAADPRPVLVFFYGGGWHSGLPGEYHFVGRTFARLGYVVVIPGYRLTPEGKFPRMLEDSAAGVKWVHDHIADYGGDPNRVFVMGHSAGAQLAALVCTDGNACTDDSCNPSSGCVNTANTASCNDGNACTTNDMCVAGRCEGGPPKNCDDGNVCTTDSCNPATGCEHATVSCDDGNACTTDSCDPATGCQHVAVVCDDANACTADSCSPASGCVFANNTAACDDATRLRDARRRPMPPQPAMDMVAAMSAMAAITTAPLSRAAPPMCRVLRRGCGSAPVRGRFSDRAAAAE